MSFRTRLLVTALATLAVGLGALLVIGNVLLASGVRSEASALLRARAEAQMAALDVTGGTVAPATREPANDEALDRLSWVLDGRRVVERPSDASPALDAEAVALGRAGTVEERDAPGDIRLRAQPVVADGSQVASGTVVVGLSMVPLERLQGEVLLGSIVVFVLVLLAGGLAIRTAVDGALRPVAKMTVDAEDWGAHDLDRRFGLGPARDEITGLAATLDGLLARIASSRRHEQRFASEVAHELRTPIAGMRGRAELALGAPGPGADAEREQALRSIVDQAARADAAIDALVAVARRELDPAAGTVDLAAIARELEDVRIVAPAGLPAAAADAEIARRLVATLVDNARRHGAGEVTIELSAAGGRVRLAVRDDGPGLDPALGESAFEPGVRGEHSAGAGLGLPLARRLARSCGGDVTACPGPGGCFALDLPSVGSTGRQ